jgi:hypothetical protein
MTITQHTAQQYCVAKTKKYNCYYIYPTILVTMRQQLLLLLLGPDKKNMIFQMAPIPLLNVTNCSSRCQYDVT